MTLARFGAVEVVEGQMWRPKAKVNGQMAPVAYMWWTGGGPFWTGHELVLSKFVRLIFKIVSNGVKGQVASYDG